MTCNCVRTAIKRAEALAIAHLSQDEKEVVYRRRFNEKHPGQKAAWRREWYQRNKDDVCEKKKQEYAEQKAGGDTYYQRNKARILARKRELYAAKKARYVESMGNNESDSESD